VLEEICPKPMKIMGFEERRGASEPPGASAGELDGNPNCKLDRRAVVSD
jgi:hypothetical protein